jgi:tetratricopeptide (TPR) repeat protein
MKRILAIIIILTASLKLFSQTAEEYYTQAEALDYSVKDDAKKAIALLTKAIAADPAYIKAIILRAEIYDGQALYKEEISDLTTLIKTDTAYAGYYKKRAHAYLLKGEAAKAISDYTEAYSIDTSMIECVYERGKIYGEIFYEKQSQSALFDFNLCIEKGSISIKALSYVGRGRVYENKEEFEKAMADYNTAVNVNPFCKDAFLYRGLLKLSLNQDGCNDILKYREMGGPNAQDYMDKYCYK